MSLEGARDRWFGGWQAARRRGRSIIESMLIDMNKAQVRTLEQVRQVVASVQAISEAHLLSVIEEMLGQFPTELRHLCTNA